MSCVSAAGRDSSSTSLSRPARTTDISKGESLEQRFSASERRQASEDSGRIPTVLIVDDEPEVREFVDRVLRQAGYVTTTADDGPSALALAAKHDRFDLLVTDVRM